MMLMSVSRDVVGQESQEKVSNKNSRSGKSGKVRKILYFDLIILKTFGCDRDTASINRDSGILKLFFGAQRANHRKK